MTLGIDPVDRHYLPRLQEALVEELYRRSVLPQLFLVPVLLLLYAMLQSAIAQRPAIAWVFIALAIILVPRTAAILAGAWLRRRYPEPRVRIWIFAFFSALVGLCMGAINVLAAPVATLEQFALIAIVAAGISSVSIVSMNPNLPSYFLSMVPNIGTIPLVVWMSPDVVHRGVFVTLLVINLLSLVVMAIYVHVNVRKAILLRIKVDDANVQLQSEIAERLAGEQTLAQRNRELEALAERLAGAQSQLLQSEKMASIGQLAAGVAHEINNPIAFVRANLFSLKGYVGDIVSALNALEERQDRQQGSAGSTNVDVSAQLPALNVGFLREDIPALLDESVEGATRIEKIVKDLKEFSHLDEADWQKVDLHHGLDTTLNVAAHELKYKVDVVRHYGDLPLVECLPFQINQVFLNLLVNAAQSIEERGTVTISTGRSDDGVWIRIADTGRGIEPAHLKRIFDPFFTTKPVGVGTGLGLSVSYSIVRRHGGTIEVASVPGQGAEFTVHLPVVCKREG
jgi:two-component system, NtrC family, sensor kinase